MTSSSESEVKTLTDLVRCWKSLTGFNKVLETLRGAKSESWTRWESQSVTIDGAWGSSCAVTVASLASETPATVVLVLPRLKEVEEVAHELSFLLSEKIEVFAAWESLPQEQTTSDIIFGSRLRVLAQLTSEFPPRILVTSITALMQPVPPLQERLQGSRHLTVNEVIDLERFLEWLNERGFERVAAVEYPGEYCLHGGILDLFSPDAEHPIRLELFGDEIESIRSFDVQSQRKIEELLDVSLTIITPEAVSSNKSGKAPLENVLESLPEASWIVLSELEDLISEGKHYLERMSESNRKGRLFTVQSTLEKAAKFPLVTQSAIALDRSTETFRLPVDSLERFQGQQNEAILELLSTLSEEDRILIACHNEGEAHRLKELIAELEPNQRRRLRLCHGYVRKGFRLVTEQLVVLSDHELFGRSMIPMARRRRSKLESRAIDNFLELREGDLVVHLTNGIGQYCGMTIIEKGNRREEHLILEFRDAVRVYVPVSLIHLVQKYVGSSKTSPKLSPVRGTAWDKKKQKVEGAVTDLAAEMIRMQASRDTKPGIAYPADSEWQYEFELAFPYIETDDQLAAVQDLKQDMQQPRPMDRLICGDVGYGKTEVAMRAAFKAIEAGKQVAVLVPTTVLAEQHFRTFSERMAEFPISVESLSRFKSKKEQKQTLERMAEGTVDVVIGTHRIVQQDVRFKNLGLLIIDEEQRFGVAHKEMLKQLRLQVDVLTLSATPIPRTLHLSLLGIRDISNLTIAPQDRLPVQTRICQWDDELIRRAIVRELNRQGQVYFVHNRVYNIHTIANRIQAIVPEARMGIAHGQMKEQDLESAMLDFVQGRTDILVCTTIIESGLDIPNANTIFIHQAGIYGLADLHQLRGRVGRYHHRAWCYLMLEDGKALTPNARRRLKAIEEFSDLGAGFKIAIRDLEIRGAGNILGTEQSGHITTVGYELYCQLLENAVRNLKNLPPKENHHVSLNLPVEAYFPHDYIQASRNKVELYRKLANLNSLELLEELTEELRDRFGPLPKETQRLIDLKELQLAAWFWRIHSIHLEDGFAVFHYDDLQRIGLLKSRIGSDLRIVDGTRAYYLLEDDNLNNESLIERLKLVLQHEPDLR